MAFNYSSKLLKTKRETDETEEALRRQQELRNKIQSIAPTVLKQQPVKQPLVLPRGELDESKVRLTPQQKSEIDKRNVQTQAGAFYYGASQAAAELPSLLGGTVKARTQNDIELEQLARQQPSLLPKLKFDVSRGYGAPNIQETKPITPYQAGQVSSFAIPGGAAQPVEQAIGKVVGGALKLGGKGFGAIASKIASKQPLTVQEIKIIKETPDIVKELGLPQGTKASDFIKQQEQIAREIEMEKYLKQVEDNKGKFKGNIRVPEPTLQGYESKVVRQVTDTPLAENLAAQRYTTKKPDVSKVPRTFQRIEEPNVKTNISDASDKPHGLYLTDENVKSMHQLGGERTTFSLEPSAKVLNVETNMFHSNRGIVGESAGVASARKFIGDSEVLRMMKTDKNILADELTAKYKNVDWNRYYDQHEMVEAVGAIEARNNGYDGIWAYDKKLPEISEFVALNEKAIKENNFNAYTAKYNGQYYNVKSIAPDGSLVAENILTKERTKIPRVFESELQRVTKKELKQRIALDLNKGIQKTGYAETVQRIRNAHGDFVDSKARTYRQYEDEETQIIVDELNKRKGGEGYTIDQVKKAFVSIANGRKLNTELHNAIDDIIENRLSNFAEKPLKEAVPLRKPTKKFEQAGVMRDVKYGLETRNVPLLQAPKKQMPNIRKPIQKVAELPKPKVVAENTGIIKPKVETAQSKPMLTKPEIKKELKIFEKPEITKGTKERGLSSNVRTDVNMPDELRQSFSDEALQYEQLANKTTLQKAENTFSKGFDEAVKEYNANRNMFKPENVPLAKLIAKEHVKRGNIQASRDIISDVAEELTRAGQFGQAARILRESGDPVTLQMTIQKQLKKLNEDGLNLYGDKWKSVNLTDDEIKSIGAKEKLSGDEVEQFMNQVGDRIAKEIPTTKLEQFNAWRRMSMLMNPKTHVRNTVGNTLMKTLDTAKDTLALGIEKSAEKAGLITKEQRTKSFGWKKDTDIVNAVNNSWKEVKKDLTSEGKYDVFSLKALGREKPTFKTKWLEELNQISKNTLEAEDVFFLKSAYEQSLGSFMKARGLKEPTEEAIKYAKNYAQEATFRQASDFANWINKLKAKKGVGTLVEAAMPFTKTPINILKRATDYTPYSLAKTLFSKGKEPAKIIDDLSKGLTGTGLISLGWMLAANGWARGDYSPSKSEEGLMQAGGEQPFSIVTPQGSYTFDWAQPVSVPLAMGVAAYEAFKDKDEPIEAITKSIAKGGDTLINQSMLKNIKELLGGGYGSATEKLLGLPVSYLEQAIPTVGAQLARTIDPVKRETYSPDKGEQQAKKIQSKLPLASAKLQPKIDIWGNEVRSENLVGNTIQQFFSPGSAKAKTNNEVTNGLIKLYKERKIPELLPKVAPKSFTLDGEKREFTPEEYTAAQKELGELNYYSYRGILPSLEMMTDDEIVSTMNKIKEDNWNRVKSRYIY